ncbi:hypothetical protein BJ912DRAFT_939043 [Pholiota molesta]|nr:hypothetical protein BJ912DRAFT_939043 [Pholiota molesta]
MTTVCRYSPPNLSSQPPAFIQATTSNSAIPAASPVQIHSPYIDALGVPYLSITDQEISSLRKRVDAWILNAPPGSKHHFHEMLVLYKDTHATHPKSWIYVPWEPGSLRYARTHEIDKFFVTLAANAKLVASGAVSIPKKQAGTSLINPPNGQPITNHTSNPTPSTQAPTGLSVQSHPTSTASSVQAPTSPPVSIPSGLTRNLPTPSQVDKKHLTKHVLFALGKRARPIQSTLEWENPLPSTNVAVLSSQPPLQNADVQPSCSRVPSIASTSAAKTLHFSAADTQPRQQSMPSIAAARPDLIQPTPIPATAAQTDIKMNSPPLAANSSSRLSVPPIETLDFTAAVETQSAGLRQHRQRIPSNLVSRLQTTTSSISTGTTTPTNGQPMQTSWRLNSPKPNTTAPKPAATKYPGQSQFQAVPTAGSSISNINPYSWLLANRSQPQTSSFNAQPSGSFSYNQIAHKSFSEPTSTSTSKSTSNRTLFLPSSSPDNTKRGKGKEVMAYVLVPKANYPIRRRQRLKEKGVASEIEVTRNRLKNLRTQSSSVSTSVVGEEGV